MRTFVLSVLCAAALAGSASAQSSERRWSYCYATSSDEAVVSQVFEYRGPEPRAPLNSMRGAFVREVESRVSPMIDAMCGAHPTEDEAVFAQRNMVDVLEARGRRVTEIWWTY